MSSQPAHGAADTKPFWQVQAVYDDPDGTGQDFAYTIGLFERGLPELHIWARPSLGEDPGHDWKFSARDQCLALNELAWMLVEGSLGVGSEVTREYDGGLARVTFKVQPPGDKEQLEAFGVPPWVDVLPVLWSLHRPPDGPLTALTPEAEEEARRVFLEVSRGLDPTRRAPRGWTVPAVPSFSVEQKFGPLTPVVLARAAQLWQADEKTLSELLYAGLAAQAGTSLTSAVSTAMAAARPVGRREHLATLHQGIHDLVDLVTERPATRARWRRVAAGFDPERWAAADRETRAKATRNFARLLHDLTAGCLMAEAVADQGPAWLALHGRGPWLAGFRRERVLSDPAWQAAPEVLVSMHRMLDPLDVDDLTTVAGIHQIAIRCEIIEAPGYRELCARLESWALTSAASCPWEPELRDLPGWRPLLNRFADAEMAPMWQLESWATCFCSALTHRARLTAEDVTTFAAPFRVVLPSLEEVLNTPL